jgi:hypothetical protein
VTASYRGLSGWLLAQAIKGQVAVTLKQFGQEAYATDQDRAELGPKLDNVRANFSQVFTAVTKRGPSFEKSDIPKFVDVLRDASFLLARMAGQARSETAAIQERSALELGLLADVLQQQMLSR